LDRIQCNLSRSFIDETFPKVLETLRLFRQFCRRIQALFEVILASYLEKNVKFARKHFCVRRKPVYEEPLQRPEGIEEWAKWTAYSPLIY